MTLQPEILNSSPKMSKGSKKIVEGNFQNLGNKHSRNKDVPEIAPQMSLESKLETLKKKYTSAAKEKPTKKEL